MIRFLKLVAAVPRAGKTFLTEKIARAYHKSGRGYVFVYNQGKAEDFKGFEIVRFLSFKETARKYYPGKHERREYMFDPKIEYFVFRGVEYHVKDLNRVLHGKKVSCYRIFSKREEGELFNVFFYYMSHALLVIDDARPILQRLYDSQLQFFGRQNHTGEKSSSINYRGKGTDIILIYHNLDKINAEVYNWATHLIMLKCTQKPDGAKMENQSVYSAIEKTYETLLSAPRFTAYMIDLGLHTGEVKTKLINTKKIIEYAGN